MWLIRKNFLAPRGDTVYDPIMYGMPETIVGYKVLAIHTPEQIACLPPQTIVITLQSPELDVNGLLRNNYEKLIRQELIKLSNVIKWEILIVDPDASKEDVQAVNEEWNSKMKRLGCLKLGVPAGTLVPRLTPTSAND